MAVLQETRKLRQFKTSEDYLYAMKEDLAEWLNELYPDLYISVHNFMERLHTGVALCKHANCVRGYAEEYLNRKQAAGKSNYSSIASIVLHLPAVRYFPGAKAGTFFARDNVSNFIAWCKNGLGVIECLLFETEDLIANKNEKHVILCLLEVARRGARVGVPAPMLVQMEREIDREIALDKKTGEYSQGTDSNDSDYTDLSDAEDVTEIGPKAQIVNNDLKSLDEMVRDLVQKCTCPTQFPMIRVSEGKYRIGDTKVLIFVRILRVHVMVRVGGGWDTLAHYLDKHDPCRCKGPVHQTIKSSTLMTPNGCAKDLDKSTVVYERTRRLSTSSTGSNNATAQYLTPGGGCGGQNTKLRASHRRSRSPTPYGADALGAAPASPSRSRSTTPRRKTKPRDASPAAGLAVPRAGGSDRGSRASSVTRQTAAVAAVAAAESLKTTELLLQITAAMAPLHGRATSRQPSVEKDPAEDRADDGGAAATCRVSDSLRGGGGGGGGPRSVTPLGAVVESRPSTVPEEESGVDTAPSSRVSDSLAVAAAVDPAAKKISLHSGFGDDCKKAETVGADSGSEGSDVGYSSWQGPVNVPVVNGCKDTNDCTPPVTRSTKTSLSKSGKHTPSPKTTPVHQKKCPKAESPKHQRQSGGGGGSRSQATTPLMSRKSQAQQQPLNRHNTWNESVNAQWSPRHLIADLVGRCAVIAPSPRRDPKPNSPVVTRIPAPVQRS